MIAPTLTRYAMCGLTIDSELRLDELTVISGPGRATPAGCVIARGNQLPEAIAEWVNAQEKRNGFIASEDDAGHLIVHLDEVATAVVDLSNREVMVVSHGDCDASVGHIVVDHVIPRILARKGATVVHATCVDIDGTAIGFVGPSGAGKSTLALSLALNGARLVADDCLVLMPGDNGIVVLPSYGAGRLRNDSASALLTGRPVEAVPVDGIGKQRVHLVAADIDARPRLGALVVLDRQRDGAVELQPLEPAEAFWQVGAHAYVFDRMRNGFEGVGDVIDATPAYRLCYPSSYQRLGDVHAAIQQLASQSRR